MYELIVIFIDQNERQYIGGRDDDAAVVAEALDVLEARPNV